MAAAAVQVGIRFAPSSSNEQRRAVTENFRPTPRGRSAMVIRDLTQDECRGALAQFNFGRLACARDDQPYLVPIYFAYDGRHIYGFSTPGQKIDWMRSNPRVCLEADERTSHDRWTSVVVSGRYEELTDTPELATERAHAQRALQERASWWEYATIPAAEWRRKSEPFMPIFYRIHIEKMTGHVATPSAPS
jgi:nitroimidazol reductase NimA-like FMN-containing flavoprotein (pyridoxamine 5'-phosphate oxidase superfamily)